MTRARSLLTALALLFTACGGGTSPVTAPSAAASAAPVATAAPAPVKIKVAYSNITGDNLSLWFAKESGIFAKNGLDAELVLIDGGSRTMAALVANEVNIAQLGGSEAMSAKAQGGDITAVGTLAPVYPYLFMAAAEIKTVADLKGKKVGVSSIGGSADIATRRVLRTLGLDPEKDVIIVSLGSHDQRTAALFSGAIQAAMDDPPNTVPLQAKGFHSLFDLAGQKLPTANTVIVSSGAWVAANRSTMQKYVDSTVRSVAQLKKDKPAAIAVLKKYFGNNADTGFDEAYEFYTKEVTPTLPYPRPEQFADAQAELGKKNDKVKNLDLKTLLDPSFVQSAADRGLDK